MNHISILWTLAIVVATMLGSCNSDVFLDEAPLPDETAVTVEPDGGEAIFKVPTKGLESIGFDFYSSDDFTYYNTKGEVISNDSPASELGRIVYDNQRTAFELIKNGSRITFRSIENDDYPTTWVLRLEYTYADKLVEINVLPGSAVELVDVEYSPQIEILPGETLQRRVVIENGGPNALPYTVQPYLNAWPMFVVQPVKSYSWITGEQFDMPILVYREGEWRFDKENGIYIGTRDYYESDINSVEAMTIEIPPFTTAVVISTIDYAYAKATGTMFFRNIESGREHTVDFTCTSWCPVSYEKIDIEYYEN